MGVAIFTGREVTHLGIGLLVVAMCLAAHPASDAAVRRPDVAIRWGWTHALPDAPRLTRSFVPVLHARDAPALLIVAGGVALGWTRRF